jgi:hypothetical protein
MKIAKILILFFGMFAVFYSCTLIIYQSMDLIFLKIQQPYMDGWKIKINKRFIY